MKKLYMKQQVFSWTDKFTVKDENDQDIYLIEGDMISIGGKKLHIKDMDGNEIGMVQQKLLSLMPKFFVFVNGNQVAEIKKKIAFFKAKYVIEGPNWKVKGSILDHDYTIEENDEEIASLHKVWLSWGDAFELNIKDGTNEIMALAVVIAIDCVQAMQEETTSISLHSTT